MAQRFQKVDGCFALSCMTPVSQDVFSVSTLRPSGQEGSSKVFFSFCFALFCFVLVLRPSWSRTTFVAGATGRIGREHSLHSRSGLLHLCGDGPRPSLLAVSAGCQVSGLSLLAPRETPRRTSDTNALTQGRTAQQLFCDSADQTSRDAAQGGHQPRRVALSSQMLERHARGHCGGSRPSDVFHFLFSFPCLLLVHGKPAHRKEKPNTHTH